MPSVLHRVMSQPDPLIKTEPPKRINKRFVVIALVSVLAVTLLVVVSWYFIGNSDPDLDKDNEADTSKSGKAIISPEDQAPPSHTNETGETSKNSIVPSSKTENSDLKMKKNFFTNSSESHDVRKNSNLGSSSENSDNSELPADDEAEEDFTEIPTEDDKESEDSQEPVDSGEESTDTNGNNVPPKNNGTNSKDKLNDDTKTQENNLVKNVPQIDTLVNKAYHCILVPKKCILTSEEAKTVNWVAVKDLWLNRNDKLLESKDQKIEKLDIEKKGDLWNIVWNSDPGVIRTDILEIMLHLPKESNYASNSYDPVWSTIRRSPPPKVDLGGKEISRDRSELLFAAMDKGHILTSLMFLRVLNSENKELSLSEKRKSDALKALLRTPFTATDQIEWLKKYIKQSDFIIATITAELNRLDLFAECIKNVTQNDIMKLLDLLANGFDQKMKPFLEALAGKVQEQSYVKFINLINSKKELFKENLEEVALMDSLLSPRMKEHLAMRPSAVPTFADPTKQSLSPSSHTSSLNTVVTDLNSVTTVSGAVNSTSVVAPPSITSSSNLSGVNSAVTDVTNATDDVNNTANPVIGTGTCANAPTGNNGTVQASNNTNSSINIATASTATVLSTPSTVSGNNIPPPNGNASTINSTSTTIVPSTDLGSPVIPDLAGIVPSASIGALGSSSASIDIKTSSTTTTLTGTSKPYNDPINLLRTQPQNKIQEEPLTDRALRCILDIKGREMISDDLIQKIEWAKVLKNWWNAAKTEEFNFDNIENLKESLSKETNERRTGLTEILLHSDRDKLVKKAVFALPKGLKQALAKCAIENGHYLTYKMIESRKAKDNPEIYEALEVLVQSSLMSFEDLSALKSQFEIEPSDLMVILAKAGRENLFTPSARQWMNDHNIKGMFLKLTDLWEKEKDKNMQRYLDLLAQIARNKKLGSELDDFINEKIAGIGNDTAIYGEDYCNMIKNLNAQKKE